MNASDEARMGLLEHLDELRTGLIRVIWGLILGFIPGIILSERTLAILLAQAGDFKGQFVVLSPTEGLMVQLKLGFTLALVFSMPWTLHCLWSFLGPGLNASERRILKYSFPVLVILFALGCLLAWLLVLPLAMQFLLAFQIAEVTPQLSIASYVSFCTSMLLVFGGVFETPVFLLVLHYSGVLPVAVLRRYRRHVIVFAFVLAAVLTPPDVVSQTALAIPMLLLFEMTLFFIGWLDGKSH